MATKKTATYDESSIKSLDPREHIRLRPGMYIGRLGDGADPEDGIYVLAKEIIDNSIDEYRMGNGALIEVSVTEESVRVRDYGRGIPLGKVVDCVSKMNTGGKYDSSAFQKSIGLNGVGTKAVNALSSAFRVTAYREGKEKTAEFSAGLIKSDGKIKSSTGKPGTLIEFTPDSSIFRSGDKSYRYRPAFLDDLLWNYAYLNVGLRLVCNDNEYVSKDGLKDLLERKTSGSELRYGVRRFVSQDGDIEVALTHGDHSGDQYYSFVNGQYTIQGGTHEAALRASLLKTLRTHYGKQFDPQDVRAGVVAAICVRIQEPVFESQTKTKLGTDRVGGEDGPTIASWVHDFLGKTLDDYLHQHKDVAAAILRRINEAETERKELAGIQKLARDRTKSANLFNKKLRDCRIHLNTKDKRREASTIFITEGDSASGSITKSRSVDTQAVFSLRGKPLNCHGLSRKITYENEELCLLQHALNLEEGLEGLRFNRVVIATDADVDGMHIRLLLLTFFLQFFPDVVRGGHLYILQTPLFRVRDKKATFYCYDEAEKDKALKKIGDKAEITRFKGLGEISPDEFGAFIGEDIRLERVRFTGSDSEMEKVLAFNMGKNTPERKEFILENLVVETQAEMMAMVNASASDKVDKDPAKKPK